MPAAKKRNPRKKAAAPQHEPPPPSSSPELQQPEEAQPANPAPRSKLERIEDFQRLYGAQWYVFLNSDIGIALMDVLDANSPAKLLVNVSPADLTQFGVAYAGNIQAWNSCIATMKTKLIPEGQGDDYTAPDYAHI